MARIRYGNRELPLLLSDTPVARRGNQSLRQAANEATGPTFYRETLVNTWRLPSAVREQLTLDRLLDKTDEELKRVAEHCDAKVVKHEWALWAPPQSSKGFNPPPVYLKLPAGHILVAEVETHRDHVPIQTPGTADWDIASSGIRNYLNESKGIILDDTKPEQLIVAGSPRSDLERIWVDIEPHLTINQINPI